MKEIEVKHFNTSITSGGYPGVTGVLNNDGKSLVINCTGDISNRTVRQIELYFSQLDYEKNTQTFLNLGPSAVFREGESTTEVVFDLTPVLSTLYKAPTQVSSDTIDIDIYTYEANVEEAYGTKRLSVPYSVTSLADLSYPESTDGVYIMKIQDYELWNESLEYTVGDTVVIDDGEAITIYNSIMDSFNQSPIEDTEGLYWEVQDPLAATTMPTGLDTKSHFILNSFVLNTRYVKKNYMHKLLTKTTYKTFDDLSALRGAHSISRYRKLALVYLEEYDELRASYILSLIPIEFNNYNGNTKTSQNNNITDFTL